MDFKEINLLRFGNEIELSGMVFNDLKEGLTYIIPLPKENIKGEVHVLDLTDQEYEQFMRQLDLQEVLVTAKDGTKTILRKSQRQIDNNIMWKVFKRDNYTCQYCGSNDVPLTVDHIITWENMGDTHPDNLICSCKKCNKTRGNLDFITWIESLNDKNPHFIDSMKLHVFKLLHDKAQKIPLRNSKRNR